MYKGRVFIREVVYICGDYIDADIYPVFQKQGKRRSKCKPTSEIQKKLNQKNAERALIRLAHNNFNQEDIALHLTYSGESPDPDRAKKDLANYINRLKRLRKLLGLSPLKYISCTEISGKGRAHHHVIISGGIDRDALEKKWGKGLANSKRLQFDENGIAGLTRYISKGKLFYRRWNRSRNLVKPEPVVRESTHAELASAVKAIENKTEYDFFENMWPGWELISTRLLDNVYNRNSYVQYEMRRRQ